MLDNEIQFELKKLENKLYSLLKSYNELKNKTEELKGDGNIDRIIES